MTDDRWRTARRRARDISGTRGRQKVDAIRAWADAVRVALSDDSPHLPAIEFSARTRGVELSPKEDFTGSGSSPGVGLRVKSAQVSARLTAWKKG